MEGLRIAIDAAEAGTGVETAFVSENALTRHPQECERIIALAERAFVVTDQLAGRIGDTKTPQGVFCICRKPQPDMSVFDGKGSYIMLSSLQDPGNVGTVIRTACTLGLTGVILSSDCPDVYSPKVLRSTMGGVFSIPLWVTNDLPAAMQQLRKGGCLVAAAALTDDAQPISEQNMQGVGCVAIGNEGNGLSREMIDACDRCIILPMARPGQSLNAGVAASIFMWELTKKR
ncbi:MAG: RNA methyltransferase [Oscillospiraceae bacterium]|nr:RNA methyltransferase [Oscillospiraceae bacterium]